MAPASSSDPAPDITIRARPPSPKRLSRNVLMAGAAAAGVVIAFALVSGLSEGPDRRGDAQEAAVAAAGGPPESIERASAQYDVGDLHRAELDALPIDSGADSELQPPQDIAWTEPDGGNRSGSADARTAAPPPDPQQIARVSPILFASAAGNASNADASGQLDARLTPPRSPYALQAGQVIPAALVTALNSDAPGRVVAQVTASVYDSVTGDHLLIPQGSRLIGTYNNGVRYGDNRIVLAWNRLILPNGWSIDLQQMEATDASGASGLRDRVDNHLDRLAAAVALSSIISVGANEAENDDEGSLGQSLGDAAAQQAAQTGARIVDRELSVRPTLRVREGAPVRVLVTRDIQLRAYRQ